MGQEPVLIAKHWHFWGHTSAGTTAASLEQGITAPRGRGQWGPGWAGQGSGKSVLWQGSLISFIPEDGHVIAWSQAKQGPGGEKTSGW